MTEGAAASSQRLEATVRGDVQGVGFRWFVRRTAEGLGLRGWVANHPDGSVNVTAEGAADALDGFLRALHAGPPGARVSRVDSRRMPASGSFQRFEIRAGGHTGD